MNYKAFIFAIYVFIVGSVKAQNIKETILSKHESQFIHKIDSVDRKLNRLEFIISRISSKNDSLSRELQFYKVKEDYFASAVDRQGTHFEFLITVLLAAAGLISWKVFTSTIDNQRLVLENKVEEIKKYTVQNLKRYNQLNEDRFEEINKVVEDYGYSIVEKDRDIAFTHLNNGTPVLALDQIFQGISRLIRTHKYLKSVNKKGVSSEIVFYIGYADEFLKDSLKNLRDPDKFENERQAIQAVLNSDPLESALELNDLKITKAVTDFYIKYRTFLNLAESK